MVHVFVPAIVSIYVKDIWVLLSVIYLFESVEFIVSQIPGAQYWAEDNADKLVFDILMGLLGFVVIAILKVKKNDKRPWYACLKPKKNTCYNKIAWLVHILLSACSTVVIVIDIPLIYQYGGFGTLYVFLALLFGFQEWAIFSFVCIISGISTILGYSAIVSVCVVLFVTGVTVAFRTRRENKSVTIESKQLLIF